MADTNHPIIVGFVNDWGRRFADRKLAMADVLATAAPIWTQVISPLLDSEGVADTDLILDGSQTDSRNTLQRRHVEALVAMGGGDNTQAGAASGVGGLTNRDIMILASSNSARFRFFGG